MHAGREGQTQFPSRSRSTVLFYCGCPANILLACLRFFSLSASVILGNQKQKIELKRKERQGINQ